ncbi:PREDICTED: uncharacterized protein LOC108976485 isoform X2 [Bactrocera latifrons]|uniref:uncharacterized protein LOC108976485 isoform X2 n=1 Tax=Bactrocera latifrons TaxID=174628 RepID=UPI0008DDF3BC|nr:PREDICTED: uncharacterized protein LOC108976485 isoform X2 [Bactrocera latifrons]
MKAIIQRVSAAKVTVGDELISSIGRGLCVLVGITHSDTEKDVEYMYLCKVTRPKSYITHFLNVWVRIMMGRKLKMVNLVLTCKFTFKTMVLLLLNWNHPWKKVKLLKILKQK